MPVLFLPPVQTLCSSSLLYSCRQVRHSGKSWTSHLFCRCSTDLMSAKLICLFFSFSLVHSDSFQISWLASLCTFIGVWSHFIRFSLVLTPSGIAFISSKSFNTAVHAADNAGLLQHSMMTSLSKLWLPIEELRASSNPAKYSRVFVLLPALLYFCCINSRRSKESSWMLSILSGKCKAEVVLGGTVSR